MLNKTIARIGIAPISRSANQDVFANVVWLESTEAGGREFQAEPQGDETVIPADGIPVYNITNNAGYDIQLVLLALIDTIAFNMLGLKQTTDGGILEEGGLVIPPRFALLVAEETLDGEKKYEINTYFNCTAKRPTKNAKTSEGDNFDPYFPSIPIKAKRALDFNGVRHTIYADELPTTVTIPTVGAPPAQTPSETPSENQGS